MSNFGGPFRVLRRAVLAGLLVIVPMAVTLWVLAALVQVLDAGIWLIPQPFRPQHPALETALGVTLAVTVVIATGFAAQSYVGGAAIRLSERLVARVPLLSTVYGGMKQLLEAVFMTDTGYLQRTMIVEWPRQGTYALAFHTGEAGMVGDRRMINVFMPTTPNPTSGFYFIMPEDEAIWTDMSVEDAFKLIMSAGILSPPNGVLASVPGSKLALAPGKP